MPGNALAGLQCEVPPHLNAVEETLASLPVHLRGPQDPTPFSVSYFGTPVATFRDNPAVQPSATYVAWAAQKVLLADPRFRVLRLSPTDAQALVKQEWRTHMTRSLYQVRVNPHEILDGPVATRSRSGVVRVQLELDPGQPIDAISARPAVAKRKKKASPKKPRRPDHASLR
ncbi:hypothetical protein ACHHYP_09807 [Achlya hypogyna]|uniref:Uncharacterized protein n=1 Tax=Achlya hypogyna TaxID=1202772 RepID=A0A1V9YMF8_ACHHY|nr:hypothetical protein ACHHYP_09807 [Achlya hypogyna]